MCCEGLGSEDVLQSIRSELGEVIYCPPTLAHRAKQLQLIAGIEGQEWLVSTDPAHALTAHIHLAPSNNFQKFTQRSRLDRSELKKRARLAAGGRPLRRLRAPRCSRGRVSSLGFTASQPLHQAVDDVARGEALGGEAGGELGQGEIVQLHVST